MKHIFVRSGFPVRFLLCWMGSKMGGLPSVSDAILLLSEHENFVSLFSVVGKTPCYIPKFERARKNAIVFVVASNNFTKVTNGRNYILNVAIYRSVFSFYFYSRQKIPRANIGQENLQHWTIFCQTNDHILGALLGKMFAIELRTSTW